MCTDRIQDPKMVLLFERIEQKVDRRMKTPKDFEYLSVCIFETLHQRISSTTLKRMWGYVPESVKPRASTLNLLAQFVGAENWEAFCQQEQEPVPEIEPEPEPIQPPSVEPLQSTRFHTTFKRVAFIVLPLLVIAGLLAVYFLLKRQSDIITFADAEVKRICVENWDTDHDGELSAAEAAAVTSLGKVFTENTTIKSFDELQFFTGLTDISKKAFSNCENLKSIIIPNNIKNIGFLAFWGCTQITELYIPKNVVSGLGLGKNPFSSTPELTSIIVDEDNPVYDSRNNCNAIIETASQKLVAGCRTTVIPDDVLIIGDDAFGGCWCMESVDIPANVIQIGKCAFSWCWSFKRVVCHWSEPISFGEEAFDHIGGSKLIVPKGTKDAYIAAGWTEEIFTGGIIEAQN